MRFVFWTVLVGAVLGCASTAPRSRGWALAMIDQCQVGATRETDFRAEWLGLTRDEQASRRGRVDAGKDYGVLRVDTRYDSLGATSTYTIGRRVRGGSVPVTPNRADSEILSEPSYNDQGEPLTPGVEVQIGGEPAGRVRMMRDEVERVLVFRDGVLASVEEPTNSHLSP